MTKLSQDRKAACDASFRLGGQRGASQVLCNSAGGALAAAAAAAASSWGVTSQHSHVLQLLAWSAFLVRGGLMLAEVQLQLFYACWGTLTAAMMGDIVQHQPSCVCCVGTAVKQ
jgi:hypothetical protein